MTPISTTRRGSGWIASPMCVHATTQERPRVRFDRDERLVLQPLAPRRHTSLVLDSGPSVSPRQGPRRVVVVEKRSLAVYAQLAGGVA